MLDRLIGLNPVTQIVMAFFGQLELGESKSSGDAGYVHLYYLVPEWRGKGLSEALDKFAMNFLISLGFKKNKAFCFSYKSESRSVL